MPRAKGKANYKTDVLIQVVEELLPNGAQGWTEVARLYQVRTGELAVREYDDVKWHWIEKCCNKFKKPTGNPGDPKRDMILRCQRIQERIHEKSSSQILGVDSGGDTGLDVSTDASDDDEESEEENGLEVEVVVAGNAGVAGSMAGSRTATPNGLLEVGLGVIAPEQVEDGSTSLPPPLPTTQQFTEGTNFIPQQQLIFSPEALYLSQQQRAHTQQSAAGQPMVVQPMVHRPVRPMYQQPVQPTQQPPIIATQQPPIIAPQQPKKKAKKSSEYSLSNEKTKNSLSEKRGSIVKSIDKLASSLTTDDANNAAMASASVSSSMMPMMFMMQMQHQQQMQQQQQQQQQQQMQQVLLQTQLEMQMKGFMKKLKKKEKKKKKKKAKRKRKAKSEEGNAGGSSSSSSSSSSSESS